MICRKIRIAGIVASCVVPFFPAFAAPRISCDEPVFEFGTRDSSETVEHSFELKNTGTSDLTITAIRPACGCTATELTRPTIPPGETAKISTKLTLVGRSGEARKTIAVESNDPANPTIVLAMEGKIATEFEVIPPTLVIRKAPDVRAASASTLVRSKATEPLKVLGVLSNLDFIKARADQLPGENAFLVSAIIQGDQPPGSYKGQITVATNSSSFPQLYINCVAIVTGKATIAPSKLALQKGESAMSRTVIMKFPDAQKFDIQNLELPNSDMTSSMQPLGDFGIRIQISGIVPKPELDGKSIIIHLSDGQKIGLPIQIQQPAN
jgi:hypothetical protein